MNTRMAKALRELGYACRDAEIEESAVVEDIELREVTASSFPVELREASGRILPGWVKSTPRTTGQPLPTMAELEQRMSIALRDIRRSAQTGETLTAVNRTQQAQKGAAALTETSTPTTEQRLAAALRAIKGR